MQNSEYVFYTASQWYTKSDAGMNGIMLIHVNSTVNQTTEKLPNVHGKVIFLHAEQSKKNPKSRQDLVDDISSKIMFDENLTICLSLRFRLSITLGLS